MSDPTADAGKRLATQAKQLRLGVLQCRKVHAQDCLCSAQAIADFVTECEAAVWEEAGEIAEGVASKSRGGDGMCCNITANLLADEFQSRATLMNMIT